MSLEQYREELPLLVRGALPDARAREILAAAETDAELRHAIAEERALERVLDDYAVPAPSAGFEARFWQRFHTGKALGDEAVVGRGSRLLRLVGPLAAGLLIAAGLLVFYRGGPDAPPSPVAEGGNVPASNTAPETGSLPTVSLPVEDLDEMDYLAGGLDLPERADKKLDAESLALMKRLDDKAFLDLDNIEHPDDIALVAELELLSGIDKATGEGE